MWIELLLLPALIHRSSLSTTILFSMDGFRVVLVLLLSVGATRVQAQLSVSSRPDVLFKEMNQTKNIVEGSVVWLYCKVNSTSSSLSVTWNKDGGAVVQNVPHIILRTSTFSSTTTFLLVIDNVVSSDAGQYQCTARERENTATGTTLTITVLSNMTGVLRIVSSYTEPLFGFFNRTAVNNGTSITLSYTAGYVGDDSRSFTAPLAMWLKDGALTNTSPTDMPVGSSGQINSTLSFTFVTSDAGVYQCIFIGGTNNEIYESSPLRLDTGTVIFPKRLSPPVIFLSPPEKLVVEYHTSGGYKSIHWTKNRDRLGTSLSEFTFFAEIYFREPTNSSDLGMYELTYAGTGSQMVTSILVVLPVSSSTTFLNINQYEVFIIENSNKNISCTSEGGPVPSIIWTFNYKQTAFSQTVFTTEPRIISFNQDTSANFTLGNITSTLHIVDAQYPTHDGVYTCTGSNSFNTSTSTSVSITMHVQAVPLVKLTGHIYFNNTQNVVLNCQVIRGNPMNYTYEWTYMNASNYSELLSNSLSYLTLTNVTENEVGTYFCLVRNTIGIGTGSIVVSLPDSLFITENNDVTRINSLQNNISSTVLVPVFSLSQVGTLVGGIVGGIVVFIILLIAIVFAATCVFNNHKLKNKAITNLTEQRKEADLYECVDSKAHTETPKEVKNTLQCHSNPSYITISKTSGGSKFEELLDCDSNPAYDVISKTNEFQIEEVPDFSSNLAYSILSTTSGSKTKELHDDVGVFYHYDCI